MSVHSAAAAAYSRVVNESDAYYRMGLTAEPKRVDKMASFSRKGDWSSAG